MIETTDVAEVEATDSDVVSAPPDLLSAEPAPVSDIAEFVPPRRRDLTLETEARWAAQVDRAVRHRRLAVEGAAQAFRIPASVDVVPCDICAGEDDHKDGCPDVEAVSLRVAA